MPISNSTEKRGNRAAQLFCELIKAELGFYFLMILYKLQRRRVMQLQGVQEGE